MCRGGTVAGTSAGATAGVGAVAAAGWCLMLKEVKIITHFFKMHITYMYSYVVMRKD